MALLVPRHRDQHPRRGVAINSAIHRDPARLPLGSIRSDPKFLASCRCVSRVWSTHQARRFLRATRHLDYYLEQPCATYEECRALRNDCDRPLVLDESIVDLASLLVESFGAPILALADDPLRR
jgi:hypothetical protein